MNHPRLQRAEQDVGAAHDERAQQRLRLELLAHTSQQLVLADSTDVNTLRAIFDRLGDALGYELYFHYQCDEQRLRLVASRGLDPATERAVANIAVGELLCGQVAERRETLIIEDLPRSPHAAAAALCSAGAVAYVGLPLLARGELLGTVAFASRSRAQLGAGDEPLLAAVCDQVSVQLARARSERRLRERESLLSLAVSASGGVAFEWDIAQDRVRRLASDEPALPTTQSGSLDEVMRAVHPDDRALFRANVDAALADCSHYRNEFRVLRPDGTVRWLRETGRVECDETGAPVRLIGVSLDVTDRRRAEDRLRASEEKFRTIAEALPGLVFVHDGTGSNSFVNQGFCDFAGRSAAGLLGHGYLDLIHPDDVARATPGFEAVMAAGRPFENHHRMRRHDGAWRWFLVRSVPQRDAGGGVVQWIGTGTDVTAHVEAQAALSASEERYRQLFESNPQPMWVYDTVTLAFLDVNAAAVEHYGFTRAEFAAMTLADIRPPDDVPRLRGKVERASRAELSHDGVWRHRRRDGSLIDVEVHSHAIDYAGRPARLVLANDVTERRRNEALLRESESRLQLAMLAGGAASWDLDLVTGRNVWSDSYFAMVGVAPTPGREATEAMWRDTVLPEDVPALDAAWARAERERAVFHSEHRLRRADSGAVIWVRAVGRFLFDEASGRAVRFVGMQVEITAVKEAELALREQDRRKDEFLAMLGHELRNPLAPISNAVQLLRIKGPDVPLLNAARDVIDRQVAHMARLVDDLLDVSRVSRGTVTLQRAPTDLASVVRLAVESTRPLLQARGHTLVEQLPAAPVRVDGDVTRLAQVVGNLLNNAAKYTDPGGIVEVAVEAAGDAALVRVRDNGRGIDAAALPHVFELFYQADRGLDRSESGLGIGLSLVRRLVELHGGRVTAASAGRGRGAEFTVRLPRLADVPADEERATPPAAVAPPLAVLVVDDNADAVESMAAVLRSAGHRVSTATDGEQAVRRALAERPQAVLLDIGLPRVDGYAACRAMRAGGLTDTLIVAMTGYGQAEDRRRSHAAGFDAHLVKPVRLAQLQALFARGPAAQSSM
jgi:PAS domain S-box-containing protein